MTDSQSGSIDDTPTALGTRRRRVAVYGGSFDPVHRAHLAIAHSLVEQFELDQFIFMPAFHAPHKVRLKPTSAFDRFAMLCLVTRDEPKFYVSRSEIETPERPYSVETLERINAERPTDDIYFVMGADSWMDITTWREWERVLSMSNHIVVTRPGVPIGSSHVTDEISSRIIDLRGNDEHGAQLRLDHLSAQKGHRIYLSDTVDLDISATAIRRGIRDGDTPWRDDVAPEVANYIEKYQIYT